MAAANKVPLLRNNSRKDQTDPSYGSLHVKLARQQTRAAKRKKKRSKKNKGHVEGYLSLRFKSKSQASLWLLFLLLFTANHLESSSYRRSGGPVTPAPAQTAPVSAPSEPTPGLRPKRCTRCTRQKASLPSTKPRTKAGGRAVALPTTIASQREARFKAQIRIHAEGSACTGPCP